MSRSRNYQRSRRNENRREAVDAARRLDVRALSLAILDGEIEFVDHLARSQRLAYWPPWATARALRRASDDSRRRATAAYLRARSHMLRMRGPKLGPDGQPLPPKPRRDRVPLGYHHLTRT